MVEPIRPGAASYPGKPRSVDRPDRIRPDAAPTAPDGAPPRLSLAAALAQKGPPFDAERIASLRAAITSGEYRVDLTSVADAIIRFGGAARS
jgi:flagellar biosynthesis anti-sigma factor FlgM